MSKRSLSDTDRSVEIKAVAVRFVAEVRSLEVELANGVSYLYPVDRLKFTRWNDSAHIPLDPRPSDTDLENVVLWPSGEVIEFEDINQGFQVAQLIKEMIV